MTPLSICSLVIILYQTVICVVVSWVVLGCNLRPSSKELHEVTLMKLLYLYEPEACGTMHFFNYTVMTTNNLHVSTIVWPLRNSVAADFRHKVRLWLTLHLVWLLFAVVKVTQGHRPCGFYVALLPFSCAGLALLMVDVVYMALFIKDIEKTATELAILEYIQSDDGSLRWITKMMRWRVEPLIDEQNIDDTSWMAVLMAYISCRGVVQWIINFWLVKDNFVEGRQAYRRLQIEKLKRKRKYDD